MTKRYFSVALLPNLVTMLNLFSGFLAIMMVFNQKYGLATGFIMLGLLWDSLDGKISRIFKNSTAFGKELDSLADIVSFIVAPSVMVASSVFSKMEPWMLLSIFFYLSSGAYRLARYNVHATGSRHFQGLPSPAAGLTVTMLALTCYRDGWAHFPICQCIMAIMITSLSVLMISNVVYPKLSDVKLAEWKYYFISLAALFLILLAVFNFETAATYLFMHYVLIAPLQLICMKPVPVHDPQ